MSTRQDVLQALAHFRADLFTAQHNITQKASDAAAKFKIRSPYHLDAHPLRNIHATGIGIRRRRDKLLSGEYAIKVFVYHKVKGLTEAFLGPLWKSYQGVDIDIEELPIVRALADTSICSGGPDPAALQSQKRPIVGGMQIQASGSSFVGTLGCFVTQKGDPSGDLYALSNNHVMFGPQGGDAEIFQPARGTSTAVATLFDWVPLQLPTATNSSPSSNDVDAAIAAVINGTPADRGKIAGIPTYKPGLAAPVENMQVAKSGRTTGVTCGVICGTSTEDIAINFGTDNVPCIGKFSNAICIRSNSDKPFSDKGDSGSIVVDLETGFPVALLMGYAKGSYWACDFKKVCDRLNVYPA